MTSITKTDFILYGQYFYINKSNSRNAFNNGIDSIFYPQNQFIEPSYTNNQDNRNIPINVNAPGRYSSLNTFIAFVGNYYDNNPTIVQTIIYGDMNYNRNLIHVFNLVNNQYIGINS
jgi:hypothetical protein